MKKMLRAFPLALVLALGTSVFVTPNAMAQQGPEQPGAATDAELLADVLAALPPGVTMETATDDQIAAAIGAAVTRSTVPGANPVGTGGGGLPSASQVPGTQGEQRIAAITARVLSVVSVTLDSVGRSGSSNAVSTRVVASLPPQVRAQVQQQVQTSRANPTPSQVAATAVVIAQIQPAAGQQQQQQQVILPIIPVGQQQLGQSVFQENPNQVSPR